MRLPGITAIILTLAFAFTSCRLDDEDRCRKGFVYVENAAVCRKADTGGGDSDSDTNTREADAGEDAGDGEETDTSSETSVPFGAPCFEDDECKGDVDYCLLNPMAPAEPGICTRLCEPGDCPDGYQCCDCSIFRRPAACTPDAGAATAAAAGCTCS